MNAPIPRSLRWQIVLTLLAIAAMTIVISWLLAVRFTTRDFEALVAARALDEASGYAQLIETQYNVRGDFIDLAELLTKEKNSEKATDTRDKTELWPTVLDSSDWERTIAEELGLSLERYLSERENASPEEIAAANGSSADALVAAIMSVESQRLAEDGRFGPKDEEHVLSYLLRKAITYIESQDQIREDKQEALESKSRNPLLYEAPIVVIDANRNVLFDGSDGRVNGGINDLDKEIEAFPIHDWSDRSTVGFVLSARQASEFDVAELTYLDRTRDSLLIGGLIAAAIALALGTLMARQISRPVSALRNSAIRLARGDAVERLPVSKGEVGAMTAAFNAMADSLEQQHEARSRMIGDLSHEINTPLSVIQLEVEALRDGMQSTDEAVEHVLGEVDLLRNLATDVGQLAESDAGFQTIQKEILDLTQFLPAAVDRWRIKAQAAGINLRISVPEISLPIEADPTRISQALGNLIRNALQHTPQGGAIEIACARYPVERLGGTWNMICVHDSGSGIQPEDLARIFERSVQSRKSQKGRGLGLTIVQQIVEAHDGHVWAESTVRDGSNFCIALP